MEISFSKDEAKNPSIAVEATVVSTQTPVAVPVEIAAPAKPVGIPEAAAPAAPTAASVPATRPNAGPLAPSGIVLGDKLPTFADVILPRINMVQGIGELKDSFTQGAIVFNQSFEIYRPQVVNKQTGAVTHPGTPLLTIMVLGFRPARFAEKVVGGVRGLLVDTEEQVRAAGGTLDYREWELKKAAGMKRFEQLAEALLLIEQPATEGAACPIDEEPVFIYEADGKRYAMALWAMKGTAFTEAAKKVFFTNRSMGCLRNGYPSYLFTLGTRLKAYDNGNSTWIPVCLPKVKTSAALLDFAKGVLSGE